MSRSTSKIVAECIHKEQRIISASEYYAKFCECIGINIDSGDTVGTPRRVAKMFMNEYNAASSKMPFTFTMFPAVAKDLISVCGIRFVSICRHHHQPIVGYAHFAYLPRWKIAGLSKIPRYIKWAAKKPSIQEELTHDILGGLNGFLNPWFSALSITASHSCMACRGVLDHEARMTTTALHYAVPRDARKYTDTRAEFQAAISSWVSHRGIL